MNNWNSAVRKFLEQWTNKKEFEGAVLSGSYAVGTQLKNSDIDIMIVLSDKTEWWQRGNLVVDGFLIEYIADPTFMWKKAFDDDYNSGKKVSVNMFAISKVLLDKNGVVAKLKEEAEAVMKKPFKKMETRDIEMAKYHLWNGLEKLKELFSSGFVKYAPLYYLHLSKIINFYASFVGLSIPAVAKIYKFLNDSEFRKKYKLEGFADEKFVSLINDCLENYTSLEAIRKLNVFVLDKLGEFKINGWELRTEIKKQAIGKQSQNRARHVKRGRDVESNSTGTFDSAV